MNFNQHSNLEGQHAFLGASKYQWIRYSDEKLMDVYKNMMAVQRGTELHAFAAECIRLRQKLPKSTKTLNNYVNDAIGFGLTPEVVLYFSDVFFGTADAIRFDEKKGFLRIHDLKTGVTPAHMEQLYIYAALFCLEYHVKPGEIEIETRIYQNDDVIIDNPNAEDIVPIMDKGIRYTKMIHDYELTI